MNKHTEGPWHITGTYCERWVVDSKSPPTGKQNIIAMLQDHWAGNKPDAMDANARLIAAAPQMLEALESAVRFIENGIEMGYISEPQPGTPESATLPAVKEAIRAAKGEV